MIELNCTYEESKKILELGYDFSKVCWTSLYEYRDQHNLNKTCIKIHVHGTGLSLTLIEDQIRYQMGKYGIVGSLTPIIPKAALEECLPDIVDAYHGDLAWYIPRNPLEYRLCRDGDLVTSLLLEEFDSACEAFIWCHENYPEELKKKFEEVMR